MENKYRFQKTIGLDFDGTITSGESSGPWNIPAPRKNAVAVINKWANDGYIVIINTLREGEWEDAARAYLSEHGILFHLFNVQDQKRVDAYGLDSRKISADIYIDDRNLGGIPDDFAVIDELVRKQIGLPYVGKYPNFEVFPSSPPNAVGSGQAVSMAPSGIAAKFSQEFMEKARTCPMRHAVYAQIMHGAGEFTVIEGLIKQLLEANQVIQQCSMYNLINTPDNLRG